MQNRKSSVKTGDTKKCTCNVIVIITLFLISSFLPHLTMWKMVPRPPSLTMSPFAYFVPTIKDRGARRLPGVDMSKEARDQSSQKSSNKVITLFIGDLLVIGSCNLSNTVLYYKKLTEVRS